MSSIPRQDKSPTETQHPESLGEVVLLCLMAFIYLLQGSHKVDLIPEPQAESQDTEIRSAGGLPSLRATLPTFLLPACSKPWGSEPTQQMVAAMKLPTWLQPDFYLSSMFSCLWYSLAQSHVAPPESAVTASLCSHFMHSLWVTFTKWRSLSTHLPTTDCPIEMQARSTR